MSLDAARLAGCLPIGMYRRGARVMVDWVYAGDTIFDAPFFEQTISGLMQRPFNLLFRHQTDIDELPAINRALPGLKLGGFIFHWSRCGSTLVSRMLAAQPQNLVLSEPRLMDFVFRSHGSTAVSDEQRMQWLKSLLGALAQKRRPEQTRCFVKFDSWHTLQLSVVRRAFPDVPWIFIYRDPIEILVSHERERAAQMIPGVIDPALLGLNSSTIGSLTADEYCAQALSAIARAALAHRGEGLFVNYVDLPEAAFTGILPHFGVFCDNAEVGRLREVARFNAKEPSLAFTSDSAAKQQEAPNEIRLIASRILKDSYDELVRMGASGHCC